MRKRSPRSHKSKWSYDRAVALAMLPPSAGTAAAAIPFLSVGGEPGSLARVVVAESHRVLRVPLGALFRSDGGC